MKPLFVYGTLQPGHSNAHILESIGGEWLAGTVNGVFYERGWGAAADFPGIVLDNDAGVVRGSLMIVLMLKSPPSKERKSQRGFISYSRNRPSLPCSFPA